VLVAGASNAQGVRQAVLVSPDTVLDFSGNVSERQEIVDAKAAAVPRDLCAGNLRGDILVPRAPPLIFPSLAGRRSG